MQTMTFPGYYSSLGKIGEIVVQAAEKAGLNDSAVYQVQLAVDEACSNIIEHAYGGEGKGDIELSAHISDSGLTVTLRDRGKPFNPSSVPNPKLHKPLEELEPRGVGLYLMRKMMDDVQFVFSPEQGNVLTMVKHKEAKAC